MTGHRKIVGIRPSDKSSDNEIGLTGDPSESVLASTSSAGDQVAPDNAVDANNNADSFGYYDEEGVEKSSDGGSRMLLALIAAGVIASIGLAVWQATAGFAALPPPGGVVPLLLTLLPFLIVGALAVLIGQRLSSRATMQQLRHIQRLNAEYVDLDDRLQAMQAHWRDADRDLQVRAANLSGFGLDAAARLHDAGTTIEQVMERCLQAASALAERGEAAQRHVESLTIAVPRVEEVTARLSENLRQAGQSAYQFGGQLEAQIANIGAEATTAGATLAEATNTLSARIASLTAAVNESQAALLSSVTQLGAAAEQQRDQALVLLAEYAASANEATSQSFERIAETRQSFQQQLEQDIASLDTAMGQIRSLASSVHSVIDAAAERASEFGSDLGESVTAAQERLAALDSDWQARMATLQHGLTLLSDGMNGFKERAAAGDEQAIAMIQRAETLLIALDSATREIDETIPGALARLSGHAETAETTIARLAPLAQAEVGRVAEIDGRLQSIAAILDAQQSRIAALGDVSNDALAARQAELTAIESGLTDIERRITGLADGPIAEFSARLAGVEQEAGATLGRTREAVEQLVTAASEQAATDLSAAIDRVAGAGINERLAAMSGHADQAVAAAAAASDRLMRQLITIADSSAALEQRAQEVSALSAEVERETLARQMALLGEALQSTAVDLTRILDMDVADQAWEAYLKGDRSIFARRATKLLSFTEARDLLRRYESDDSFKAQVNRYIHDFEAMLRGVMDTRDGHALSVTLLSSDIGKLYVALAQAIERLRR
jgi:hypothetical protein